MSVPTDRQQGHLLLPEHKASFSSEPTIASSYSNSAPDDPSPSLPRVSAGTSDPYVKFKIAGKEVFRSKTIHKNLNPVWDERFCLLVDSLREPLYVKVRGRNHTQHSGLNMSVFVIRVLNDLFLDFPWNFYTRLFKYDYRAPTCGWCEC